MSLRQNVICSVLASAESTGLERVVAISFLMTAAEPKAALGANEAEAKGRGGGEACRARTARVRVLKRKHFPEASVRCCQSLEEVGEVGEVEEVGGVDMI